VPGLDDDRGGGGVHDPDDGALFRGLRANRRPFHGGEGRRPEGGDRDHGLRARDGMRVLGDDPLGFPDHQQLRGNDGHRRRVFADRGDRHHAGGVVGREDRREWTG